MRKKESRVERGGGKGMGWGGLLIFKPTINWRQDVYGQS